MGENINLLYVDDEPINLMLFSRVFKDYFNIITADSGSKGLEILRINPGIKIVVSDMKMPGMNGIEFIKIIKREIPGIPCFIMTGYDMDEEIKEALNIGMVKKCFKKPLDKDDILNSVMNVLGN